MGSDQGPRQSTLALASGHQATNESSYGLEIRVLKVPVA